MGFLFSLVLFVVMMLVQWAPMVSLFLYLGPLPFFILMYFVYRLLKVAVTFYFDKTAVYYVKES